jgi:hypothetical protein
MVEYQQVAEKVLGTTFSSFLRKQESSVLRSSGLPLSRERQEIEFFSTLLEITFYFKPAMLHKE